MTQYTMKIQWEQRYEVGNFEIDSEHKVFVHIIQKIQHAIERQREADYIDRLLLELLKYAEFHFCSEENIMLDVGYPRLSEHHQKHKHLLFELRSLLPEVGNPIRNMERFLDFLMKWFSEHTTTEDQHVANYINRHEA